MARLCQKGWQPPLMQQLEVKLHDIKPAQASLLSEVLAASISVTSLE